MEKYALQHLQELYLRTLERDEVSITPFYSEEERAEALSFFKSRFGKSLLTENIHLLGGHQEADRQRLVFSPFALMEEDYVGAIIIESKDRNFPGFEHREILGALMGLGLKRGLLGDILVIDKKAYLFYAKEAEETLLSLEKVARENVNIASVKLSEVPEISLTETRSVTLPSLRLDTLIAHVYLLSREEAKEAISKGLVKVGQTEASKNDYVPSSGERISLKGKGKFRYIGEKGYSKKGKLIIEIEVYK